jgi:hypothetical protein
MRYSLIILLETGPEVVTIPRRRRFAVTPFREGVKGRERATAGGRGDDLTVALRSRSVIPRDVMAGEKEGSAGRGKLVESARFSR